MHELIGHVSVSRCAELLSERGDQVERSALSRYCDQHGLKVGRRGRQVMVDFEAVQAHRAANYTREVMSGVAVAPAPALTIEARPSAPAKVTALPGRDDPARGLKEIQLRQALRAEAEDEGRLCSTAEVDAGAADAIAEMRAAFAQVATDYAETAAAELQLPAEKVRMMRATLKRYARQAQDRFAKRLSASLADANEEESDAYARLTRLAAVAIQLRSARRRGAVAAA